MSSGYIMALDVGDVRIGVAIASQIARIPAVYTTIDRSKTDDVQAWLAQAISKESIGILVVGLPRDMNGRETEQTGKVRDFVNNIEKALDIPIVMQDEAVTSINAEEKLKSRGKPYTKADIDAESACIILQDYLNNGVVNTV